MEIVTEQDPSAAAYSALAQYAYLADQIRKGDLAAARAVQLAPERSEDSSERSWPPSRAGDRRCGQGRGRRRHPRAEKDRHEGRRLTYGAARPRHADGAPTGYHP